MIHNKNCWFFLIFHFSFFLICENMMGNIVDKSFISDGVWIILYIGTKTDYASCWWLINIDFYNDDEILDFPFSLLSFFYFINILSLQAHLALNGRENDFIAHFWSIEFFKQIQFQSVKAILNYIFTFS